MRKFILFATTGVFIFGAGLAWAQKVTVSPRRPTPTMRSGQQFTPLAVSGGSVTPLIITFAAGNPESTPTVAGSSAATAQWTASGYSSQDPWHLTVGASSAVFPTCTTVPISAVSVQCTSATKSGTCVFCTAGCVGGLQPLSTTPVTIASGHEGYGNPANYTVVLSYQFADSWSYAANTCSATITYTVSHP